MADGRCRSEWNHTAAVLAMLANTHRNPKRGRPFSPLDFHPYASTDDRRKAVKREKTKDLSILFALFVDPK
ncbi:MAG: hypothetical protein ACE5KM_13810 [Planctomycetaceae bacterium]